MMVSKLNRVISVKQMRPLIINMNVMACCLTAVSHWISVALLSVRSGNIFLRAISENTLQPPSTGFSLKTRMSRRKRRHLKSPQSLTVSSATRSHNGCLLHQGILLTPIPFIPWHSGLSFPRYNLTLKIQGQRSRSKVPQSVQCPVDSFP